MVPIDEDVETTTERVYRNQDFDVPPAEPSLEPEAVEEVIASPSSVEEPEPVEEVTASLSPVETN